ncbi:hypothetical protein CC80DRAFT_383981, partial [Byssothecium circinans]
MRGAYHHQGRGGPYHAHSPPYPANQYSPQGHSPYPGGRGGWNGHQYPSQGSPTHGYSPNQSPYPHNYSPGQQPPYHPTQQYQGAQSGFQNASQRGGFRGNYHNGPDRRLSGPSGPGFTPVAGRGRTAPTQFSNLSWTPASGTRGGRPATEAPRPAGSTASSAAVSTQGSAEAAVDADDNPFRPSKDLRVEDEGAKEGKKMPPPTKPAATPTAPKAGAFGFSLKTKNPVPPAASKAKVALDESEPPKASEKPRESLLEPKPKESASRESSSRYPPESRTDRDARSDREYRDREREYDRERDRRYEKYDDYYDRRSAYRDPRDRDPRDSRDVRDRDLRDRDPRERDPR